MEDDARATATGAKRPAAWESELVTIRVYEPRSTPHAMG
jgi:hypothetical protein